VRSVVLERGRQWVSRVFRSQKQERCREGLRETLLLLCLEKRCCCGFYEKKRENCSSFLVSSSSFLELQTVTHQERKRELQRNKELREENCRVLRELQFSLMGAKTLVQGPSFIHE